MTPLQALASGVLVLACLLGVPALLALAGLAIIRHRTPTTPTPQVETSPYVPEYNWAAGESEFRAPYDWKQTGL